VIKSERIKIGNIPALRQVPEVMIRRQPCLMPMVAPVGFYLEALPAQFNGSVSTLLMLGVSASEDKGVLCGRPYIDETFSPKYLCGKARSDAQRDNNRVTQRG
jgi:hypothetical protein